VACGRFLAPEGRYFRSLYSSVSAAGLVPAGLAEIAAGARWVKLIGDSLAGSGTGPSGGPGRSAADRAAPGDPAHAVPAYRVADVRRLAVHSTSRHVRELIDAGADSVEHGYGLDEAGLAALADRGGAWTPTLCVALGFGCGPDPEQRRSWHERRQRLAFLLPLAVRLGVTIMTGTDRFGSIPREVALMTQLGLAPCDALAAATTAARGYLGFGVLGDGEPADLVSFDDDPRDDPAVQGRPAAVLVRGRRCAYRLPARGETRYPAPARRELAVFAVDPSTCPPSRCQAAAKRLPPPFDSTPRRPPAALRKGHIEAPSGNLNVTMDGANGNKRQWYLRCPQQFIRAYPAGWLSNAGSSELCAHSVQ